MVSYDLGHSWISVSHCMFSVDAVHIHDSERKMARASHLDTWSSNTFRT